MNYFSLFCNLKNPRKVSTMNPQNTYEDLWESDELSDVMFLVGEEPDLWWIAGHKLILASRNQYFYEMFHESEVKEEASTSKECKSEESSAIPETAPIPPSVEDLSDNTVRVSDIRPEIFDQLLRFLYTNKIDEIGLVDFAILLHEAAHRYKMKEIVVKCIDYLALEVCEENIFHIYNCFQEYMNEEESLALHAKCAALIDEQPEKVFNTNAFLNVAHEVLTDISSRSTLQLSSELVLFRALLRWSLAECKRRHLKINDENKRLVLGKALFNVRFGLLTDYELGEIFKKEGVLKNDDKKLFLSQPRRENALCISRFSSKNFQHVPAKAEHFHGLSFISDRKVILTSVVFFNNDVQLFKYSLFNNDEEPIQEVKHFKLTERNKTIVEMYELSRHGDLVFNTQTLMIPLKHPIYIQPRIKYTISVIFTEGVLITYCEGTRFSKWNDGKRDCFIEWKENVIEGDNFTDMNSGQLFELRFCIPIRDEPMVKSIYLEMGQKLWFTLKYKIKNLKDQAKEKWKK